MKTALQKIKKLDNKNFYHLMSKSSEYNSWYGMKRRCYNKAHKDFKNHGARGIVICERWLNSFQNFYNDMGPKPSSKHTLDRINNEGNYEPSNCRWSTSKEQNNNTRANLRFKYKGSLKTISEISSAENINYFTLYGRVVERNMSLSAALSKEIRPKAKSIDKNKVITLILKGLRNCEISKILECDASTVSKIRSKIAMKGLR